MCVHSVTSLLRNLILSTGLMLPIVMVQLTGLGGVAQAQSGAASAVISPYCQFKDACSSKPDITTIVQNQVGTNYCQFHDGCSSPDA